MSTIFSLASLIVIPAWLALMFLPFRWPGVARIVQFTVPLLLSTGYLVLILMYWGDREGGFDSLASVRALYQNDGLVLAGWLHYLAFDLFIGAWLVQRARTVGLHHGWTLPCLPLTFMFGPIGLLLYFALEGVSRLRRQPREATA